MFDKSIQQLINHANQLHGVVRELYQEELRAKMAYRFNQENEELLYSSNRIQQKRNIAHLDWVNARWTAQRAIEKASGLLVDNPIVYDPTGS